MDISLIGFLRVCGASNDYIISSDAGLSLV